MSFRAFKRGFRTLVLCAVLSSFVFSLALPVKPAYACTCVACPLPSCTAVWVQHAVLRSVYISGNHNITRGYISALFVLHREWYHWVFFNGHVGLAMQKMTDQFTAVAMQQMFILGSFMDSEEQLRSQRLQQKLKAKAHKDYVPTVSLCSFGTTSKSLGASDHLGQLNSLVMSRRAVNRALLNANSVAAEGPASDISSRVEQFKSRFCDPQSNNNGLGLMCQVSGPGPAAEQNKDVDFTRTLYAPLTLELNFSDNISTPDEAAVEAMTANLYGHDVITHVSPDILASPMSQRAYLDVRSLAAKRNVAQNSFNAIAAMKSQGDVALTGDLYPYMARVFKDLVDPGVTTDADIGAILGEYPSYWAQMELLSSKMYQRPQFYTDLYETPANIKRTGTAMRAISLMQNMDGFDSRLRNEMALAVLLELKVRKLQKDVQDDLTNLEATGEKKP